MVGADLSRPPPQRSEARFNPSAPAGWPEYFVKSHDRALSDGGNSGRVAADTFALADRMSGHSVFLRFQFDERKGPVELEVILLSFFLRKCGAAFVCMGE